MARPTSPILLSPEQNTLLQVIAHSREVPHSLVQRAQIVLAAGAGRPNNTIGEELELCEETVVYGGSAGCKVAWNWNSWSTSQSGCAKR